MLYSSSVWKNDLDTALSILPELSGKAPCSVLVTGSTGLIGTAVVHLLLRFNDTSDSKIDVLATGRAIERVKEHFSDLLDREDLFMQLILTFPGLRISTISSTQQVRHLRMQSSKIPSRPSKAIQQDLRLCLIFLRIMA